MIYTRDFLIYFVKNFDRFKYLQEEKLLQDDQNLFVQRMSNLANADETVLLFLIGHEYMELFVEDIVDRILCYKETNDDLLVKALSRLVQIENTNNVSYKNLKTQLAKKISA